MSFNQSVNPSESIVIESYLYIYLIIECHSQEYVSHNIICQDVESRSFSKAIFSLRAISIWIRPCHWTDNNQTPYLLIPSHNYQQSGEGEGESEHGNFHLSFIRIKSPRNSPSGREILTLLSVVTNAFWMRIVDTTLRIPANRDLLQIIFSARIIFIYFKTHPEKAKAAQETQAMERMVLYPHSPW